MAKASLNGLNISVNAMTNTNDVDKKFKDDPKICALISDIKLKRLMH
jgi:hypothetical protein